MGRKCFLVQATLLLCMLLASAPLPAVAGDRPDEGRPYKVKDLRVVSGPSPFAADCPGARFDDTNITGHELEPTITVNPANPATSSQRGSRTSVRSRRAVTWSPPRWMAAGPGSGARSPA